MFFVFLVFVKLPLVFGNGVEILCFGWISFESFRIGFFVLIACLFELTPLFAVMVCPLVHTCCDGLSVSMVVQISWLFNFGFVEIVFGLFQMPQPMRLAFRMDTFGFVGFGNDSALFHFAVKVFQSAQVGL